MKNNEKIITIIVNYCKPQDTIECVKSVLNSKNISSIFILIVDNGSNDDSYYLLSNYFLNESRIKIISTHKNLGFTGGYNIGIKYALERNFDWVFILNNDTTVLDNTIRFLLNPSYDVVIPKILVYDTPNFVWSAGAKWRKFPPGVIMEGYLKNDSADLNRSKKINYATGCAIMIRQNSLKLLNGFDDDFINYFEDYDFFYRANQIELNIYYEAKSIVFHKISQTLGNFSKERWFFLGRNSFLFFRKNNRFPYPTFIIYVVWFLFRESLKGNIALLPSFINGLIAGRNFLEKKMDN